MMEAMLSFLRRQIGLRTDVPDSVGSVHARLLYLSCAPITGHPFGGTGVLGDATISSNTTISGVKHYNNLTVNAGVTLTCESGTIILVKNTLTVNGLISASGKGSQGGPAVTNTNGIDGVSGLGIAGAGGSGGPVYYSSTSKMAAGNGGSTDFSGGTAPTDGEGTAGSGVGNFYGWKALDYILRSGRMPYGAGGGSGGCHYATSGAGGAGGGTLVIEAKNVVINSGGAIRADGVNGGNASGSASSAGGGGGGGGGIICLNCFSLTNNGTISASGGTGGAKYQYPTSEWTSYGGGAGGPGIVAVISRT